MSPDPGLPLERALRAVAEAASSADVLSALVEETSAGASRAALFLLRHGRMKGWCCRGYDPAAARRLAAVDLPLDRGWPGSDGMDSISVRPEGIPGPDFGQGFFDEAITVPLRVGGEVIAFLLLERASGEAPLELPYVRTLVLLGELRLELDLARRKSARAAPAEIPAPAVAPRPEPVVPPAPASCVVPPREAPSEVGLVPIDEDIGPQGVEPRILEARRFARLVATDIRLYNEEAVLVGRRQKDLATRLAEQLKRGRESFQRRFPDLGADGLTLLDEAYLEVLAAGDPVALSR